MSRMMRAHKIRIYPTKLQEAKLWQHVGGVRFVYNWALEQWQKWLEDNKNGVRPDKPNWVKLSRLWTEARPEWAKSIPRYPACSAIKAVSTAFNNHFRKGSNWPQFKHKRKCTDAFQLPNDKKIIRNDGKHIHIPCVDGDIRMAEAVRFSGRIMHYTVSCRAGKWFVSVVVSVTHILSAPQSTCGVDVGMKNPATCSDGTRLVLPDDKLQRLHTRHKRMQRILARRTQGSKRRAKAAIRCKTVNERINNIRRDCIHKFTSTVCKNHATVVVEDVSTYSMHDARTPKAVRRAGQASCMHEVLRQLEYKAVNAVKANRWYPSSQLCSSCGARHRMPVHKRTYRCPACGLVIDRDLNAAMNLKNYPGLQG